MNAIKFISRLSPYFNAQVLDRLNGAATTTADAHNLTFKVMEASLLETTNVLKIYVQTEQLRGEKLDQAKLTDITRRMFNKNDFKNIIIEVKGIPYTRSNINVIDAEWVANKLKRSEVTIKNMADDTGIDKTNLSAWVTGSRPMSQPVRALMHYYFKWIDQQRNEFTIGEVEAMRNIIKKLEEETISSTKKMLRHQLRSEFGFYISEFKEPGEGFTLHDFENLLAQDKIRIHNPSGIVSQPKAS